MQNLGGLLCPICLDYYIKPVTAVCGHSFCQHCLEQYFLHFNSCPTCDSKIRQQKQKCIKNIYRSSSLGNFVQSFIQNQHPEVLDHHRNRQIKIQQYKQSKALKQFASGMKIDVRDNDYIWRQGRIMRVISRVGQPVKYIKIVYVYVQIMQYNQNQNAIQEQFKTTSERVSTHGFYTSRIDIPKHTKNQKTVNSYGSINQK